MKENYSINEILIAVDELQNLEKKKKINLVKVNKKNFKINSDIPSSTLQLIEEAEKTIRSKLQSE